MREPSRLPNKPPAKIAPPSAKIPIENASAAYKFFYSIVSQNGGFVYYIKLLTGKSRKKLHGVNTHGIGFAVCAGGPAACHN